MADTTARTDRHVASGILLTGGVLAILGNALHPFLPADVTTAGFLEEASSAIWAPLHLAIAVSIVLLTIGLVLVLQELRGTAAESLATVTGVLAVIGGTIFTLQVGVIDGFVLPALAAEPQTAALLGGATAVIAFDGGILSLVVLGYLGVTFVLLGLAFERVGRFAPWIRRTALVSGGLGVIVGLMMFLGVAPAFTFVAFRLVGVAITVVALAVGVALRREATVAGTAPAAA